MAVQLTARTGPKQRQKNGTQEGGQDKGRNDGERMARSKADRARTPASKQRARRAGQGKEGCVERTKIFLLGKQGNKWLREEGKGKEEEVGDSSF